MAEGRLRMRGWPFDLHAGEVHAYVPAKNASKRLTHQLAAELSAFAGETA